VSRFFAFTGQMNNKILLRSKQTTPPTPSTPPSPRNCPDVVFPMSQFIIWVFYPVHFS